MPLLRAMDRLCLKDEPFVVFFPKRLLRSVSMGTEVAMLDGLLLSSSSSTRGAEAAERSGHYADDTKNVAPIRVGIEP